VYSTGEDFYIRPVRANGDTPAAAGTAPEAAPSRTRRRADPGVPRRALKRSQRQRLIDAMIELSVKRGYADVPITELCAYAGVSPVTFY
jgi:hypothetical protein